MGRLQATFVFLLVAANTALAQRTVKPGFNLFSKEQDIQLGREAAAQVERQVRVARDSELNSYVNRIGQRLAATPEADRFPYTFKVVGDDSINAFALPGGPTYVHTGLIRAADNEAQLAGVMAHEIAHVALRHGTHQASKANLLQLPAAILGGLAGGGGSMLGQLAQLGIGLGFNSVLLKFSRDAERDADILGARMMARAGYNPLEMARFFEKLEAQGGRHGPQFLASHPNPGNRMRIVQEEIRYIPQRNFAEDSGDFRRIQARAGSVGAGQGGVKSPVGEPGEVRPSSRFRQFRGRAFSIAYPDNWEVFGDADSAILTIAPRGGIAQDSSGNSQIAWGAMASYYIPQNGTDLQRDTRDLVREMQRTNPSLQVGDQRQRGTRLNGQRALVTTLYSTSPYRGETEHDVLVTLPRPQGLFYILFISPASGSREMQNTFETMLRSLTFHD